MANELEKINLDENQEDEKEDEIDKTLAPVTFEEKDEAIIRDIVAAENNSQLEMNIELFNINQRKKNAIRMIKLEGLLGKVEDQAIKRFEERPDQVSNRELLDYMQVVSAQIDRSEKVVNTINDKPMIKPVNSTTNVQINVGTELDRDSKSNVVNAIKGILGILQNPKSEPEAVEEEPKTEILPDLNSIFINDKDENE